MFRDWKSITGVLTVFALGCLAGLFLGFIVVHHRVVAVMQRGSPAYEQMLERRLSRGLHLDDGQRTRLHETLVANIEARKKLQAQLQPQLRALNLQTSRDLQSMFTPDQLATFQKNLVELRRRFASPGLGGRAGARATADNQSAPATNAPATP